MIKKLESEVLKMLEKMQTNSMQLIRIHKHPIQMTEENLVVVDDLENGELRIYEHTCGSLNVLQLLTGYGEIENCVLVAKTIINDWWNDKEIFIHKVFCEYGYEFLIEPIICQIINFLEFYDFYSVIRISDKEYERLFPYAKEPLAGFKKENRVYIYNK